MRPPGSQLTQTTRSREETRHTARGDGLQVTSFRRAKLGKLVRHYAQEKLLGALVAGKLTQEAGSAGHGAGSLTAGSTGRESWRTLELGALAALTAQELARDLGYSPGEAMGALELGQARDTECWGSGSGAWDPGSGKLGTLEGGARDPGGGARDSGRRSLGYRKGKLWTLGGVAGDPGGVAGDHWRGSWGPWRGSSGHWRGISGHRKGKLGTLEGVLGTQEGELGTQGGVPGTLVGELGTETTGAGAQNGSRWSRSRDGRRPAGTLPGRVGGRQTFVGLVPPLPLPNPGPGQ